MRLTNKLYAQHLGWWFKQQWKRSGQRVVRDDGIKAELESLNFRVINAEDVLKDTPRIRESTLTFEPKLGTRTPAVEQNEPCYVLGDGNVLLEGTQQAQALIKTIEIEGLPKHLEDHLSKVKIPATTDRNVQNAILASHLFDAEQQKTAIVKIPERPAFVTPRNYGISDARKNRLIISKLIFECEKLSGRSLSLQHRVVNDLMSHVSLRKDSEKLQLNFTIETLITSKRPLESVKGKYDSSLPDMHPLKCTISIPQQRVYDNLDVYPITHNSLYVNPHTIFLHFSPLDVKNLHDTPVTDNQFQARSMLKAFAVAAARGKQLYGENATVLEKPIVVQSIQTDGKLFHFGVYQLNTLDIDGREGVKNYWFHLPTVELFSDCKYDIGRPTLNGYNKNVIKFLSAFYNNS